MKRLLRLEKSWRILATGLCFFLFGIGGIILSFILIPVISFVSSKKETKEHRVQIMIHTAFKVFCELMKYTGAMDYKITGFSSLSKVNNCIIVANHPSLIDYVLIVSQLKQCDCIVKSTIWSNPFMRHIVKAAGYIPNDTPEKLLTRCQKRLDEGNNLLIFPEGTRTTLGVQAKLQRGAAQIAVRTLKEIQVVHITVSPSFLTKETKWYNVPETKPFFHVEAKSKVELVPFIEQTNNSAIAARQLTNHLTHVIFPQTNQQV